VCGLMFAAIAVLGINSGGLCGLLLDTEGHFGLETCFVFERLLDGKKFGSRQAAQRRIDFYSRYSWNP